MGEGSGHIWLGFYLAIIAGILTAIATVYRFAVAKVKGRRRKKEFIKIKADILADIQPEGDKDSMVICAWCTLVISEGDGDARKAIDGICEKCRQEVAPGTS